MDPNSGCPCCKKCFACLDYLQAECCSCVGLCRNSVNQTEPVMDRPKSIIGDIRVPTPMLWDALMEGADPSDRWEKITYPVDYVPVRHNPQETLIEDDVRNKNCTVAFLNNEMGDSKCEKSCDSMGSTSYRWFNNGCCECIGHNCVNYGVNEAKCGFLIEEHLETPEHLEKAEINYEELSDEELRMLEAEYGLIDEEDARGPED